MFGEFWASGWIIFQAVPDPDAREKILNQGNPDRGGS
jgi:hypothetical protein